MSDSWSLWVKEGGSSERNQKNKGAGVRLRLNLQRPPTAERGGKRISGRNLDRDNAKRVGRPMLKVEIRCGKWREPLHNSVEDLWI